MTKHLALINLFLIFGCSNINLISKDINANNLEKTFRSSIEYLNHRKSEDYMLTVLKSYKVIELDIVFTAKNSGEAKAFELFIKNNTQFTLELLNYNLKN